MKKAIAIIVSIMLVLAITIPAAAISTIAVKSITLNNSKITMKVRETSNLAVTFTPANTTQKKLAYVTSNKKVATINSDGQITAVRAGIATITVLTVNKTVLAKCDITVTQPKKVKLTLWIENITPERDQLFKEFVKRYSEMNQYVAIDYLGIPGTANDAKVKLDVGYAAGTAPDVHDDFIAEYFSRGVLEPLDSYFDKWSDKDKISKGQILANRSIDTKESKLYAMPEYQDVKLMWMRSDWFKAANIPIPQTWNEFFAAVPKLTDKAKGIYGLSIRGGGGGAQTFATLMYDYSGITAAFTKDGKSTINDPKNLEFAEKFLGLYNVYTPEDDLSKGWTELAATFQSGKAAIIYHSLGSATSHEKAFNNDYTKFEAVNFPKGLQGYRTQPIPAPAGYVISNTSQNKEEAWELIKFLSSGYNNAKLAKIYGAMPINSDAKQYDYNQLKPYFGTAVQLLNDPATKYYEEPAYLPNFRNILTKTAEPMMQQAMVKKVTVKAFLDQWADEMTKEKASFDSANKK